MSSWRSKTCTSPSETNRSHRSGDFEGDVTKTRTVRACTSVRPLNERRFIVVVVRSSVSSTTSCRRWHTPAHAFRRKLGLPAHGSPGTTNAPGPRVMNLVTLSFLPILAAFVAVGCGGSVSPRDTNPDGGTVEAAASAPCPATPAGPSQGTCDVSGSCSYNNQLSCFCEGSSWTCIASNCLCSEQDAGDCVNQGCTRDSDCPSGQLCSVGRGTQVCSVGCLGESACPAGAACQMFAP
jgi:hypothetical protein